MMSTRKLIDDILAVHPDLSISVYCGEEGSRLLPASRNAYEITGAVESADITHLHLWDLQQPAGEATVLLGQGVVDWYTGVTALEPVLERYEG